MTWIGVGFYLLVSMSWTAVAWSIVIWYLERGDDGWDDEGEPPEFDPFGPDFDFSKWQETEERDGQAVPA